MEYKQALPDRILMSVEKPARYTGGEINSVIKDKNSVDIRFAMCFPDVYEIGMSHLGIQILYSMFNERDDVWCERVYSVWPDLHKIMKEENIPLFALESQDPVREFDFLGITLQYEMAFTNVLQVLDLSHIPLHSEERGEDDPIVIGGGPCVFNPEPMADFFDIFYIGEGETVYDDLLNAYKANKAASGSREDFLKAAAKIEGLYIPRFYEVSYGPDGKISSFSPKSEYAAIASAVIKRQVEKDMDSAFYPEKPVVPYVQVTQDRAVLEIQRGCIRGCRFCQAGMIYRPFRTKSLETLKRYSKYLIDRTGYDEISLSSLSSSDYPRLNEYLEFLIEEMGSRKVNISLPSLRIDQFSLDIMSKIQDVKKSSLTFAPEAGTQRMRDVINKGITEDDIIGGAKLAFEGGWSKVKLYFMLGLPTETEDDIRGIADLAELIAETYYDTVPKEKRNGKAQITVSTSFFIPKAFTPFQYAPMHRPDVYLERAAWLSAAIKEKLNRKSIRYIWHDAKTSVIEGLLARGDRRLCRVIENVYLAGGIFDAWTEFFDYDRWIRACSEAGVDLDFYVYRGRDTDEILPWSFIDAKVTEDFMRSEWKKAMKGETTPNCREACAKCGAFACGCGICREKRNAEAEPAGYCV